MSTLFSTSSVPQSDRFGYWHDAIRNSFVRTSLVSDCAEGFSGEIDTRPIDALNVSIITAAPMTAWRSDSDVRTSTPDVVFLQILLEGTSMVEQDGRQLRMRPGEMCLVDPSRPYSVKTSQARHAVLGMPASRLRRRVGETVPLAARAISMATCEGCLAARCVRSLASASNPDDPEVARRLASQVIDVAALAVTQGAPETVQRLSSPASVARLRLHHAIDACVSVSGFGCEDIAGMAGISARYANVLLAPEGTTLERLVIRRRLDHCSAALADLTQKQRTIGDIARDFGFASGAHFARCFKQAYGVTASEYRETAGSSAQQAVAGAEPLARRVR